MNDLAAMQGRWMHSFEEDEADVRVYRPQSFAFPPSRRPRESLELGTSGTVGTGMPGADDRTRWTTANLVALGANRYRIDGRVVEVVEASPERLRLRFV
jgi:hypothetical protein